MIGPIVLVLPVLSAILGALILYDRGDGARGSTPLPEVADPDGLVAGWHGSRTFADGSRLDVELLPLHADPVRQDFDAQALAARLGLPEGAPWQLKASWSRAAAAERAERAEGAEGIGGIGGIGGGFALGSLAIEAAQGARMAPLAELAEPPALSDPIYTLFAAPLEPLVPGAQAVLVMWITAGPPDPERDLLLTPVCLTGLAWAGAEPAEEGPAGVHELGLEPFRVPRRAVSSILAYVDPSRASRTPGSGKDLGAAASRVRAPDSRGL